MKIPKPAEADRERFTALVPAEPDVEIKPMFGNLGAFVNGNMFMGLFGADVGIKLPEDDRQRLLAEPGTGPFGPEERPMAGYVTVPADWPAATASEWIGKSLAYVATLPPKKPKPAAKPRRLRPAAGPMAGVLLAGPGGRRAGDHGWRRAPGGSCFRVGWPGLVGIRHRARSDSARAVRS